MRSKITKRFLNIVRHFDNLWECHHGAVPCADWIDFKINILELPRCIVELPLLCCSSENYRCWLYDGCFCAVPVEIQLFVHNGTFYARIGQPAARWPINTRTQRHRVVPFCSLRFCELLMALLVHRTGSRSTWFHRYVWSTCRKRCTEQ